MAIRYNSDRFTKDADFSTEEKYLSGNEKELLTELGNKIDSANESLPYDTMCRCQRSELRLARNDATFPTLTLRIGYAPRSQPRLMDRLLNGQSPTIVEIDYSYNEAVLDVEILRIGDGETIQAYSFLNLLAEKIRALLQQPKRHRHRRQDVYDINLLITTSIALTKTEQSQLVRLIARTCKAKGIRAHRYAMDSEEIKSMAKQGYADLAPEIDGPLPDFDETFATIRQFYERLPWEELPHVK